MQLFERWQVSDDKAEREKIWHRILEINADQAFTIGIVCCTKQTRRCLEPIAQRPAKRVSMPGIPGRISASIMPDSFFFTDAK